MNAALMNFRGGKAFEEGMLSARKIKKSHTSLTGALVSVKDELFKAFESDLERDFLILLDFDPLVSSFYDQPVRIPYELLSGKMGYYTPDILVYYRTNHVSGLLKCPLLAEIKYKKDLQQNHHEYALKFKAAEKYAQERGWEYKVLTEDDIRTPLFWNAKFLRSYRRIKPKVVEGELLLEILQEGKIITVQELLDEAARRRVADSEKFEPAPQNDFYAKASLLSTLWYFVLQRVFVSDLSQKLTMQSPLWIYTRDIPMTNE